jgi:uncharacterized protein (DUF362 family)
VAAPAHDLVVVEGGDSFRAAERAVAELGGIERWVHRGDRVLVTPNLAFARPPETGANTHPDVLRAVIEMCRRAGAAEITVLDYGLDPVATAHAMNGAAEIARRTGIRPLSPEDERAYAPLDLAGLPAHARHGIEQKLARAARAAQVIVAVPVFKQHEAAGISGALKKAMGLVWERPAYHRADLDACIAELNQVIRPSLFVMDATRVLQTRGPKGPGEVTRPGKVIASVDPVAADAWACRLLTAEKRRPDEIGHLAAAARLGRGRLDVDRLRVREVTV